MFLYYIYKKLLSQKDNKISYFSSIEEAVKILEMLGINGKTISDIESYTGSLKDYQEQLKINHFISTAQKFNIEILSEIAKDYWASIYDQNNLREIYEVLKNHKVKLILGGHNHVYQDNIKVKQKDDIRIVEGAIFYNYRNNKISYNDVIFTDKDTFEIKNI